jgi:hypothetical protein
MKLFTGTSMREARKLIGTFIYFWILIGLFVLFRSVILKEPNLLLHHGFTIINAWMLARLTLITDQLRVADRLADSLRNRPLIYPILLKSAVLSVLLIGFYLAEVTAVGIWHGKTISDSVPNIGGGGWRGLVVVVFIMFVGLIPFFAYRELARVIGEEELHLLVFEGSAEK